ncbi:MAG: hypothetical protein ABEH47_05550 [Haloferacaceae archaeon]
MTGFPTPFGSDDGEDGVRPDGSDEAAGFDDVDEFVPEHLPEPGPFLEEGEVLTGEDHAEFHRTTREAFEERGVYDVTFGYNLARLNLDRRHPDAGFRYAETEDGALRAEFTPTTEFCPQSGTLTKGALRAWNGLSDRHGYDVVRVRVAPSHHRSEAINGTLADLESALDGEDAGDERGGGAATADAPTGDATRSPF